MDKDEALTALSTSTRKYRRTEQAHKDARAETIQVVLDALRAGAKPTEVVNASPFTAAYVRKLARENGIEAAKK